MKKDSELKQGELELINKYTRRSYSEDEIYVFSLVLCDNEYRFGFFSYRNGKVVRQYYDTWWNVGVQYYRNRSLYTSSLTYNQRKLPVLPENCIWTERN